MLKNSRLSIEDYSQLMDGLKLCCKMNKELSARTGREKKTQQSISLKTISRKIEWILYRYRTSNVHDLESAFNRRECCDYETDERIAIYTCIIGEYDSLKDPIYVPNNCDFFSVTDKMENESLVWHRIDINNYQNVDGLDNTTKNRFFKFFPNLLFPDYKYSIYVDGSVQIYSDLSEHINRISDIGVSFFRHQRRKCAYDEIEACLAMHRGDIDAIKKYKNRLVSCGFPRDYGLAACGFIVREHNNPTCKRIMEDWWREYQNAGFRDQICLPYVLYKNKITVDEVVTLGGDIHKDYSFDVRRHE